jgi:hypothetical protein
MESLANGSLGRRWAIQRPIIVPEEGISRPPVTSSHNTIQG